MPFPPLGDLPNPGIEPVSPALAGRFFIPLSYLGSPSSFLKAALTDSSSPASDNNSIRSQHALAVLMWTVVSAWWFLNTHQLPGVSGAPLAESPEGAPGL